MTGELGKTCRQSTDQPGTGQEITVEVSTPEIRVVRIEEAQGPCFGSERHAAGDHNAHGVSLAPGDGLEGFHEGGFCFTGPLISRLRVVVSVSYQYDSSHRD